MAELNLDDIVLLIHSEVASAVTSAQHFGAMDKLSLDSVRVRMGQNSEEESVAINANRYPVSDQGWLIDVTYRADTSKLSSSNLRGVGDDWSASLVIPFFARQSIRVLEGIGQVYQQRLNQFGIERIVHLVNVSHQKELELSTAIGAASFRRLKTIARLALAVPPIQIPGALRSLKLQQLLNQFNDQNAPSALLTMADESRIQLLHWLEQLELCFDDAFFKTLTFNKILTVTA